MAETKKINLEWSDSYALDVKSIDNAHKEIFQMAALLFEKNMAGNKEAVIESLEYLKKYVIWHFEDEEKYMLSSSFPGYANHTAEHAAFRERIIPEIEKKLVSSNYSQESVEEFIEIVSDWLRNHIMIHDKLIDILKKI